MNESWITETMELIGDLEKQLIKIEGELSGLFQEKEELEQQIMTADNLIRLYRNKHKVLPTPLQDIHSGYFGNKTYPEMLREIATKSGGYFKVLDATEIMLQADVSKDKRAIQANIYAALHRLKDHFIKVKRGEYRYSNGVPKQKTRQEIQQSSRSHSGVQVVVKNLKDKNPQMTKKEVLSRLLETGFDFKGKMPVSAVNIVWAKLGYHKEDKQQSLPGVS